MLYSSGSAGLYSKALPDPHCSYTAVATQWRFAKNNLGWYFCGLLHCD